MAAFAGLILAVWIAIAYGAWVSYSPDLVSQKLVYALLVIPGWAAYRAVLPSFFPPLRPVGTPAGIRRQIWIGGLAGLGLCVPILLLRAAGYLQAGSVSEWPLVLLLGGAVPILEELFYRDGLQRFLAGRLHPALSILLTSVLFGLVHAFPASLYTGFCGLLFGVLYWRYGLISAILAHAAYNLSLLFAPWVFH